MSLHSSVGLTHRLLHVRFRYLWTRIKKKNTHTHTFLNSVFAPAALKHRPHLEQQQPWDTHVRQVANSTQTCIQQVQTALLHTNRPLINSNSSTATTNTPKRSPQSPHPQCKREHHMNLPASPSPRSPAPHPCQVKGLQKRVLFRSAAYPYAPRLGRNPRTVA
jgi:hypothetical protein